MIKRKSDKKTVVVLLLLWVKIISICSIECSGKVVKEERESVSEIGALSRTPDYIIITGDMYARSI